MTQPNPKAEKEKARSEEQARIEKFMKHYEHLPKEEQDKIRASMDRAADAFFNQDLTTPDIYYLDLDFVRDTKLGTILTFVKEQPDPEAAYQEFRKALGKYQLRLYDETTPYFPFLGITEEVFLARRADLSRSNEIFRLSPVTQYVHTLEEKARHNHNHSQVAERWKKRYLEGSDTHYVRDYDAVHIFVNTWPLVLSPEESSVIASFFSISLKMDTTIISQDPLTFSPKVFSKFEDITTFHLKRFMDNETLYRQICDQSFTNKHFFAALILPPIKVSDDEFRRQLDLLTGAMRLFYNFQWLHSARFCCDLSPYQTDRELDPLQKWIPLVE